MNSEKVRFPPHFSLDELTRSQTAARKEINNTPDEETQLRIARMAWWLESLRTKLRARYHTHLVLIVSSGYRCEELNSAIGGSRTSAHVQGLAADITCPGLSPLALAEFIRDNMAEEGYDQVIHEFGRWVHVGLSATVPRQQLLTAMKEGGRTAYKNGLLEIAA